MRGCLVYVLHTLKKNGALEDTLFNDLPFESYYLFDVLKSSQSGGQTYTCTHAHEHNTLFPSLIFIE